MCTHTLCMRVYVYTYTHRHMHVYTLTRVCARVHSYTLKCPCTHTGTRCTHPHTCVRTHMHLYTHVHTHIFIHTLFSTCWHAHHSPHPPCQDQPGSGPVALLRPRHTAGLLSLPLHQGSAGALTPPPAAPPPWAPFLVQAPWSWPVTPADSPDSNSVPAVPTQPRPSTGRWRSCLAASVSVRKLWLCLGVPLWPTHLPPQGPSQVRVRTPPSLPPCWWCQGSASCPSLVGATALGASLVLVQLCVLRQVT